MKRVLPLALVALLGALAIAVPAPAADLPVRQPAAHTASPTAAIEDYVKRRADLLLIRSMFDVVPHEDIVLQLGQDLQGIGADGPSDVELQTLDDELLTESSYLLVSLRYLVEAGGALWPTDRPETSYENDTLVQLDAIRRDLLNALDARQDPLPELEKLDAVNALTEGHATIPPELDHFGDRDTLVDQAMAQFNPRVSL